MHLSTEIWPFARLLGDLGRIRYASLRANALGDFCGQPIAKKNTMIFTKSRICSKKALAARGVFQIFPRANPSKPRIILEDTTALSFEGFEGNKINEDPRSWAVPSLATASEVAQLIELHERYRCWSSPIFHEDVSHTIG